MEAHLVLLNDPIPMNPKCFHAGENGVGGKESMIKGGEGLGVVSGGMVESRSRWPMLLTLWSVESTLLTQVGGGGGQPMN